ncbi:class II aldolase/adducin family protein [Candidatus Sumerlaeota bacterium]|nr:class II aldolase/adducin family protein [Candidatus Sumerlaeota bacterium]
MTYGTPLDEPQLSEWEAREQLCEVGRWLWHRQYVEANGGNMSYRMTDGRILATPTMISKGMMKPEDMVILDPDGNQLAGKRKKTSEILVHLQILRNRPDIRCVIHCHPPHATTFAISGKALPKCVHPEQEVFLGEVPIAPYETPGTQKVADTLTPYVHDFNVFLLASHGAVAAGRGILDAYWKIEIVEAYCRLIILSQALGGPTTLSQQQMSELLQIKRNLGIHDRRFADESAQSCACASPAPADFEQVKPLCTEGGDSSSSADPDAELIRRVTEAVIKKIRSK